MIRPLVGISAAVVMGMALGLLMGQAGYLLAAALISASAWLCLKWGAGDSRFKYVLWVWFFALGTVWYLLAGTSPSLLAGVTGHDVTIKGEVTHVRVQDNRQTLTLKLLEIEGTGQKGSEELLVYLPQGVTREFASGQILRVTGRPELIRESGNPGSFSYRDYLERRGTFTQIKTYVKPVILSQDGSPWRWAVEGFRARARALTSQVMGERENSVFQGILFGDTDKMAPDDKEVFSTTGVLHAFAVSGSNVAFVLFLGLMLTSFLPRLAQLALTAAVVEFYAVLPGGEGPVIRATLMALLVLGGYGLSRRGEGLNSLALAAFLMLAYNPRFLTDAGFQLSFAATWGLIELVPEFASRLPQLPSQIRDMVLFPLAAQVTTLPLLAYYFYQVSLVGILANILVTWFLALILEIGLAAVSAGLIFPALGKLLLLPLDWLIKITLGILEGMARVPGAALWVIRPPVGLVVAYYVGLLLWLRRDSVRARAAGVWRHLEKVKSFAAGKKAFGIVLLLALLLVPLAMTGLSLRHELQVEFLDVGQGDSILISTPGGRHYLVDGGPRSPEFDAGKSVVVPYLLNRGISRLDGVFLTHPHDDHSGGLIEVVKTLPVNKFYTPPLAAGGEPLGLWEQLRRELTQRSVPVSELTAGQALNLEPGLQLRVFSPGALLTGTHSDLNNNSLVMGLFYGSRSVLLTADVEMEALTILSASMPGNFTVLKIPHHGSKYAMQRDFLDRLSPVAAVISVGKNNFGQPAPEVSAYWRERNTPLLRTDRDGLVAVRTDGRELALYAGRESRLILKAP